MRYEKPIHGLTATRGEELYFTTDIGRRRFIGRRLTIYWSVYFTPRHGGHTRASHSIRTAHETDPKPTTHQQHLKNADPRTPHPSPTPAIRYSPCLPPLPPNPRPRISRPNRVLLPRHPARRMVAHPLAPGREPDGRVASA